MWNDVVSVNINYVNNNGTYILCELPDVEEMYDTEEDFLKELKSQFDEFNKNDPRDVYEDEGIEIVDSYELELVRNVLRSTGKWDNDEIDNLFWVNHDIGFHSLVARTSADENILKVCKQEHAKSATGVEYNGFKPETIEKIDLLNLENFSSLEGCPKQLDELSICGCEKLKSLKYISTLIGKGGLGVSQSGLVDLSNGPKEIEGNYYCNNNPNLKRLNAQDTVMTGHETAFHCYNNDSLKRLKELPKMKYKDIKIKTDL